MHSPRTLTRPGAVAIPHRTCIVASKNPAKENPMTENCITCGQPYTYAYPLCDCGESRCEDCAALAAQSCMDCGDDTTRTREIGMGVA